MTNENVKVTPISILPISDFQHHEEWAIFFSFFKVQVAFKHLPFEQKRGHWTTAS